jgi:uncharacterized protein YkwD
LPSRPGPLKLDFGLIPVPESEVVMGASCRLFLVVVLGVVCPALTAGADAALKLSKEEQALLDLVNQARQKEKLPPLKPNPLLFQVAREHAAAMGKKGELAYVVDGKGLDQRLKMVNYDYMMVGENIASGKMTVKAFFDDWMKTKQTRETILMAKFEETGIGLGRDAKGQTYLAHILATPQAKP